MTARLAFKEPHLVHQYELCQPALIKIVEWMLREVPVFLGDQKYLTITSVWREDGIHSLYRAVDVSLRDWQTGSLIATCKRSAGAAHINNQWEYGKLNPQTGRPYQVCVHHRVPPSEWHYHIQVREETRRRGGNS